LKVGRDADRCLAYYGLSPLVLAVIVIKPGRP
jgi:hypothetical protein